MKQPGEITIEQMLSQIRANPDQTFVLSFVRATGKKKGTVKTVAKCKIGAHPIYRQAARQPAENKDGSTRAKNVLMVDSSQLACHNAETGEYLTPLISHIIGYNLKKVIHANRKNRQ